MNITYHKASTFSELEEIFSLQSENLHANLSEEERQKQGFVSVSHTIKLLEEMNTVCPHIIAKYNNRVVGYALSMHPSFADRIPLLVPMFDELETLNPQPKDFMIMGQICIDKEYRGKGVFRNLYATMKKTLPKKYSSIITEIDTKNLRSINAHKSVGFNSLKTYFSLGQDWNIVILENN